MVDLKQWTSVLAVAAVVLFGVISAAPSAQRGNSLDELNPLSLEVCGVDLLMGVNRAGNGQFQIPIREANWTID